MKRNIKDAPFVYTKLGQIVAEEYGIKNRKKGNVVFFGFSPLQECPLAETWIELGYIERRNLKRK